MWERLRVLQRASSSALLFSFCGNYAITHYLLQFMGLKVVYDKKRANVTTYASSSLFAFEGRGCNGHTILDYIEKEISRHKKTTVMLEKLEIIAVLLFYPISFSLLDDECYVTICAYKNDCGLKNCFPNSKITKLEHI
jgi:hypothetical protein